MTKKTSDHSPTAKTQDNPQDSSEKLLAIRDLLFGEQVNSLKENITSLNTSLNEKIKQLEKVLELKTASIEAQIQKAVKDITVIIDKSHNEHSEHEAEIQEQLNSLEESLKEFRSQTEDELGETHQDLDKTAKEIYQSLKEEVNLLTQKIERTSKELSSNKADRKTLANLLESMASNLNKSQA